MNTQLMHAGCSGAAIRRPLSNTGSARRVRQGLIAMMAVSGFALSPLALATAKIYRSQSVSLPVAVAPGVEVRVMLDDRDATPFAKIGDNEIVFSSPFTQRRRAFDITVVASESGEVLYQQTYRKARASDVFDTVDVTAFGQMDTVFNREQSAPTEELAFKSESTRAEQPDEDDFSGGESGNGSQSDLLAALTVQAQRSALSTTLELEAVNTTNPENTVRFGGPMADVTRFSVGTDFNAVGGSRAYLNMGDTNLSVSNSLVNAGTQSRGIAAGFHSAGDRFKAELGRVYGADIVGAVRGPIAWSTESFRTNASAEWQIVDGAQLGWSLNASLLDARRPQSENFGVGENPESEVNRVKGVGSRVNALDDRLTLDLSWASSDYNNPLALNAFDTFGEQPVTVFSPGTTSGSAWRHTLNWDAWDGYLGDRPTAVGVEFAAERASPLFHSIMGSAFADRKQWSAALNAAYGPISARLDTTRFRNNLNNLVSIHTLDEAIHSANIDVDLQALRYSAPTDDSALFDHDGIALPDAVHEQSSSIRSLIPSSVSFNAQVETVNTLNGDEIILAPVIDGFDFMSQTTQTLGMSTAWQGVSNATTLELAYTFLDNAQRERADADQRDMYYGLSHELWRDRWSLSARLGFTDTDDLAAASRSFARYTEWGLGGSFSLDNGIDLTIALDSSRSTLDERVFDERSLSVSERYGLSVDVGRWMQRRFNLADTPSVSASWYKTESVESSAFFDTDGSAISASLNIGISFQ